MAVPSNTSPPGEWMRRLISVRSPSAFRSRANCWAVMPHIPISSYSRISACPLESALMLYQLSLGALLAVRAAMGASSARLLVVRIGASSVVIRLEPGPGDFQIATVLVHQLPRLGGSDHLAYAEVGLLYRLHRRHAFFLGVVIGVRAEHQPFFPVGLDLGNSTALKLLRVATAGAGNLRLIGKACLDQQLPGVRLFLRIDPGHDRALVDGAVKGARVNVEIGRASCRERV